MPVKKAGKVAKPAAPAKKGKGDADSSSESEVEEDAHQLVKERKAANEKLKKDLAKE